MSTDQYYDRDVQRAFSKFEKELGFPFGHEDDANELSSSPYPNEINSSQRRPSRKRPSVSANLEKAKGKGTKKGRRTLDSVQSSASQPHEPKRRDEDIKELVEKKSLLEVVKVLIDRVDRRIKNEDMADMKSIMLVSSKAEKVFGSSVDLNLIQRQWPVRSDLANIKKEIRETSEEIKDNEGAGKKGPDEMKQRLVDIGQKIKKYDEQKREDSTKVKNLEKLFTDEGVSPETQREKLSAAFPWLFQGEIETKGLTAEQDQGRLPTTREQLLEQIVDKNNNKVDVFDFPDLKEAMEKTTNQRSVPDYLKPIVIKIKEACGTTTEFANYDFQLLVCAAIKEMEDVPIEDLDSTKLLRWGAALNKAGQLDFRVKFAEDLFWKNVYAFFAFSNI